MHHVALFRRLALSLPGAEESSHCGAADFRLRGRLFATLAYAAQGMATLKLTPEQQGAFLAELPELVRAAPGGWGRMGLTLICLSAPEDVLRGALLTAYNNHESPSKRGSRSRPPPASPRPARLQ